MRSAWTPQDDLNLRSLYPEMDASEIAQFMGRSKSAIHSRARKLGIKKSADWLREMGCKWSSHPASVAHRFSRGHHPSNKGKKMSDSQRTACTPTMFGKGHRPHNAVPVGTEVVTKDGYIKVKIAEPKTWKFKAHLVWEAVNGPVPSGYIIEFIDGNRRNCSIENLRLISRSEQLNTQNSLRARYPEELQKAIRIKGALKRQITLHNRKNHE